LAKSRKILARNTFPLASGPSVWCRKVQGEPSKVHDTDGGLTTKIKLATIWGWFVVWRHGSIKLPCGIEGRRLGLLLAAKDISGLIEASQTRLTGI